MNWSLHRFKTNSESTKTLTGLAASATIYLPEGKEKSSLEKDNVIHKHNVTSNIFHIQSMTLNRQEEAWEKKNTN